MHRFQLIEVACIKYGFIEDFMTKSLALIKNKNKTATLKKKKKTKSEIVVNDFTVYINRNRPLLR